MLTALKNINTNIYNSYIQKHLVRSSIFYWYKRPRGGISIDKNSIFYTSHNNLDGVLLVHNGYSFGDSINSENFNYEKFEISPHDCAGFINYVLGTINKDEFSNKYNLMWTYDMHNLNNFLLNVGFNSQDAIKENLFTYAIFAKNLNAIPLKNIKDVKEGDILIFRKFSNKQTKNNSNGIGGHVGIVLETDGDNKIYILSYKKVTKNLTLTVH